MSEELDVNKMAAEFVTQNIEKFYNTGKDVLKGAADKARLHLSRSYRDYLACIGERYSKAKSFFIRSEPTNLYDFYVPIGVSGQKRAVSQASLSRISSINRYAVITGGGGSGKSMLLRHLLLDAVTQKEKVPIFLELRELNQTEQSLIDFIKDTLHSNHFTLDDEYIEKALKAGHFALLLDGFDELAESLRNDVRKQIFQLTKNYDQNIIVISSRPDSEFSGWSAFSVFKINELTLEQACELVEKLPFDSDLKTKFLRDLRKSLFQRHQSFLSNPLLLSIMLLTYGQSADIPDKLSIFYSQAYEALFQRHDALKAGFQRDRLTGLNILDFGKVFSLFSLLTYDNQVFQMPKTDALDFIEKSKALSNLNFSASEFLKDAEQAVCLLVEDGLQVIFAHRSFQEYFTARYILNAKPEVQRKLIEKYSKRLGRDSVLGLLYEMNPELMERLFIIPELQKLEQALGIKNKIGVTHFLRFLKKLVAAIHIGIDVKEDLNKAGTDIRITFTAKHTYWVELLRFIFSQCGHLVDKLSHRSSREDEASLIAYAKKEKLTIVSTSSLTTRSEITNYFAKGSGFISKASLERIIQIKNILMKKHQTLDKSLDEIISN